MSHATTDRWMPLRRAAYRVAGIATIAGTLGLSVATAGAGVDLVLAEQAAAPATLTSIVDTSAARDDADARRTVALRAEFARRAAEAALRRAAGPRAGALILSVHGETAAGLVIRRAELDARRAAQADALATLARRTGAPDASAPLRRAHAAAAGRMAVTELTLELVEIEMLRRGV